MFTIYALKSISHNFIYVGMTENLTARVERHNKGYVKSTKKFAPFKLFIPNHVKTELMPETEKNF
jgi:putative endonuclease